jgi:hypothetical protein
MQELEQVTRTADIQKEVGLLVDTGLNGLVKGNIGSYAPTIGTRYLYLLEPLQGLRTLIQCRVYLKTPLVGGQARTAIYQMEDQTTMRKIGGSDCVFPLGLAGLLTKNLDDNVLLKEDDTYAIGFVTEGGGFSSYLNQDVIDSTIPFFTSGGSRLPPSMDLKDWTKNYADNSSGPVAISYLTPLGKELL